MGPVNATYVNYGLYQDAANTLPWTTVATSTTCTTSTQCTLSTGTGSAQIFTIYGTVPSGQTVAVGTYTDTVSMTIIY
jgi:spore coat protein U-like protein